MRTKEKAYAKLNLALNIKGVKDGYHILDSVVTTVDLYDVVTVSTRKDDKITLKPEGLKEYVYDCNPLRDNAYKAAFLFNQTFKSGGADIVVRKRIPLSGGMGGSSTDAAAVLRALAKMHKIEQAELVPLAREIGSDVEYLLKGGIARIVGRGEVAERIKSDKKLFFVVVFVGGGVNTAECFKMYDQLGYSIGESAVNELIGGLCEGGSLQMAAKECKNMLFNAAAEINPEVLNAYNAIKALSPMAVFMTGSGATVCGMFEYYDLCLWAKDKLLKQGFNAETLKSVFM